MIFRNLYLSMIPYIVDLGPFTTRDIIKSDKFLHLWLCKLIIIFCSSAVFSLLFRVAAIMINTVLYVVAAIPDNVLKPIAISKRYLKLIALCLHNKILLRVHFCHFVHFSWYLYKQYECFFFVYLILLFYRHSLLENRCTMFV